MLTEIKQVIREAAHLNLSMEEIRSLTLSNLTNLKTLEHLEAAKDERRKEEEQVFNEVFVLNRFLASEVLPKESIIKMKSKSSSVERRPFFLVHQVYGSVHNMEEFASCLEGPVYGLKFTKDAPTTNLNDLARHYIKVSQNHLWCWFLI